MECSANKRLQKLLSSPQTTKVVDRLVELVKGLVTNIAQLDDVTLRILGLPMAHFIMDTTMMDDRVAQILSSRTQPAERERLIEDAKLLGNLDATGAAVSRKIVSCERSKVASDALN